MQIVNVKINNYKSLFDFNTPNFSEINFIHGLNNSGKSNFFEFLELLFQERTTYTTVTYEEEGEIKERRQTESVQPYWDGQIYDRPFIFYNDNREIPIEFEVSVRVNKNKFRNKEELLEENFLYETQETTPIDLIGKIQSSNETTSHISLIKVKLGTKIIYESGNGKEKVFEKVKKNSSLKGNRDLFESILNLLSGCTYLIKSDRKIEREKFNIQESPDLAEDFKKWLFNLYIDSQKYSKFKELTKFLDDFKITNKSKDRLKENVESFPFDKTNIGYSRFNDELEIMLNTRLGRFPLKNFGTGIKQIFYILTHIFNSTSDIILIEELELNLSPEYQEFVINNLTKFIEDNYLSQVFFSSHSDYLYRNDYKIFEIKIDKEGKSTINRSDYNQLNKLRRKIISDNVEDEE